MNSEAITCNQGYHPQWEKFFKIRLCNIKSHETIWSRTVSWDISTTLRNLRKKKLKSYKTIGIKQNHLKSDYDIWDQSKSKTRQNYSNSLECSPTPLDHQKTSPSFSNPPCVTTILWLINKLPGVVHDLIIVVGECLLKSSRAPLLQVLSEVIRVSELP